MKKISLIILFSIVFNLKNIGGGTTDNVHYYYNHWKNKLKNNNVENVHGENVRTLNLECFINAIIFVETRGSNVHNPKENAIGYLQIRPVMVQDVNRIVGYNKFKHSDAWDKNKSIEMFKIYQDYYNPNWDWEKGARIWNGGPTGDRKQATLVYWEKVNLKLNAENIQC